MYPGWEDIFAAINADDAEERAFVQKLSDVYAATR